MKSLVTGGGNFDSATSFRRLSEDLATRKGDGVAVLYGAVICIAPLCQNYFKSSIQVCARSGGLTYI